MEQRKATWLKGGFLSILACSVAVMALPEPASAGGVRISIGVGVPAPVYIAPPPVVVYPAPVIVQPAPRVIFPPPAAFPPRHGVYGHSLPPGLAKQYYGVHPAHRYKPIHRHKAAPHYKFYKAGKHRW